MTILPLYAPEFEEAVTYDGVYRALEMQYASQNVQKVVDIFEKDQAGKALTTKDRNTSDTQYLKESNLFAARNDFLNEDDWSEIQECALSDNSAVSRFILNHCATNPTRQNPGLAAHKEASAMLFGRYGAQKLRQKTVIDKDGYLRSLNNGTSKTPDDAVRIHFEYPDSPLIRMLPCLKGVERARVYVVHMFKSDNGGTERDSVMGGNLAKLIRLVDAFARHAQNDGAFLAALCDGDHGPNYIVKLRNLIGDLVDQHPDRIFLGSSDEFWASMK